MGFVRVVCCLIFVCARPAVNPDTTITIALVRVTLSSDLHVAILLVGDDMLW